MSKSYPSVLRDDVVHVTKNHMSDVTIEKITKEFGVHSMTLQK
jgi:hypothetical protein